MGTIWQYYIYLNESCTHLNIFEVNFLSLFAQGGHCGCVHIDGSGLRHQTFVPTYANQIFLDRQVEGSSMSLPFFLKVELSYFAFASVQCCPHLAALGMRCKMECGEERVHYSQQTSVYFSFSELGPVAIN